jgi:sugar lactone lactonase YvrE
VSIRIIEALEQIDAGVCEVGEGPIWDDRFDALRWVDLTAGLVHGHDAVAGQLPALELGQPVGFVVPTGTDELLAGVREGFARVSLDGAMRLARAVEPDRPHMRMNDGKADPAGRVWAGRMAAADPGPEGALHRLDADWSLTAQLTGLTIPNGIGWSPDGSRMYFTDTTWGRIDAFAYDLATGELGDRGTFAEIPAEAGQPDGLTVDADGCVWIALWTGAAVHRYTPEGRLDTIVRTPAPLTTACAFGGKDHKDLFITSARLGLTEQDLADHPRSGRVFTCRPGVAGLRPNPFRPRGDGRPAGSHPR